MARFSRHLILLKELFPFTFVVIIWLIHLFQGFANTSFAEYSLYPRDISGLIGIVTAPLIHGNFSHLIGNSVPLIILGFLLFTNYKEIAGKVFWLVYFSNGILLWFFAREAFHLGASGVVYGLAFFLFLSGFIRKIPRLTMISFLLIFIYGSMVWGVLPFDPSVSWEAHLYGALAGIILAFVLRKQGPQPVEYWPMNEASDDVDLIVVPLTAEELNLLTPEQQEALLQPTTKERAEESVPVRYIYDYKKKEEK